MPQLQVASGDSPQELVFVFHQEGFRNQTWVIRVTASTFAQAVLEATLTELEGLSLI